MRRVPGAMAVSLLLVGGACRMGQPVLVSTTGNMSTPGTIAGIVSAPGGDPIPGRNVEAIAVDGDQHYSAVTSVTGGFSIKVPPGDYRLKVDLQGDERVVHEPGVVHINKSDLDANLKIVVGS